MIRTTRQSAFNHERRCTTLELTNAVEFHLFDDKLSKNFLNRHYAPQFHWLLNLSRHTTAKIRLRSVSELSQVTRNVTPYTLNNPPRDQALAEFFNDNMRLHFYLQLDNALMDLVGQTVSFKDIVEHLRTRYPDAYKEIIERSITLCNALV